MSEDHGIITCVTYVRHREQPVKVLRVLRGNIAGGQRSLGEMKKNTPEFIELYIRRLSLSVVSLTRSDPSSKVDSIRFIDQKYCRVKRKYM